MPGLFFAVFHAAGGFEGVFHGCNALHFPVNQFLVMFFRNYLGQF